MLPDEIVETWKAHKCLRRREVDDKAIVGFVQGPRGHMNKAATISD
jgi:hypothetical protein